MNQKKEFQSRLTRYYLSEAFRPKPKGEETISFREMLALIGIVAFFGAEAVKVLFRTNFGKQGIDRINVIMCCVGFLVISYLLLFNAFQGDNEQGDVAFYLNVIFGLFYIFLALLITLKTVHSIKRNDKNVLLEYEGESKTLRVLAGRKTTESFLQNTAEPFLMICLGFFISFGFSNFLAGMPLAFCGFSVVGLLGVSKLYFQTDIDKRKHEVIEKIKSERKFHKAKIN